MEERARDGEYRIAAIPGREWLYEAQTKIYRINWPDLDFEKEVNADLCASQRTRSRKDVVSYPPYPHAASRGGP